MTEKFRTRVRELNTVLAAVPPGCTSLIQPLDVSVNALFKDLVDKAASAHYQEHLDDWTLGKIGRVKLRQLLCKWVGDAWDELNLRPEVIIRSFKKCGITVNPDGSEDSEINIRDLTDYKPCAERERQAQIDAAIKDQEEAARKIQVAQEKKALAAAKRAEARRAKKNLKSLEHHSEDEPKSGEDEQEVGDTTIDSAAPNDQTLYLEIEDDSEEDWDDDDMEETIVLRTSRT